MLVVALLAILPLSLQRDLSSLSFTSILSVLSVISLLGFVTWYSPVAQTVSENGGYFEVITTDIIKPSFIMGMGIFGDAFACQHAAFVLSGSLHKLTPQRWGFASAFGIGFTCIMFLCMGVVGFFGFYNETDSDILNNFDSNGYFGKAARLLLAVSMCFTYPIEAFVCRHVLTQIVYGEVEKERLEYLKADNKLQRRNMTLLVFSATMVAGLILDDLGIILALTGIVGVTTMAYIGPGLIYLGIFGDEFLHVVSEAFANTLRIFHEGQCVSSSSLSSTLSPDEKLRCLNANRQGITRIDRFLEIQLHQNSSKSTSPSFFYRWVKGNLVNTWEDSM
jgi:sodium-coupled neutral amino acid transporter 11